MTKALSQSGLRKKIYLFVYIKPIISLLVMLMTMDIEF